MALIFLFAAGFCELSFSSMNQTLVQLNTPNQVRGKVLGLFGMSSSGLRLFSGISVGLLGSQIGIHLALFGSVFFFIAIVGGIAFSLVKSQR
jgi:MFS family permease